MKCTILFSKFTQLLIYLFSTGTSSSFLPSCPYLALSPFLSFPFLCLPFFLSPSLSLFLKSMNEFLFDLCSLIKVHSISVEESPPPHPTPHTLIVVSNTNNMLSSFFSKNEIVVSNTDHGLSLLSYSSSTLHTGRIPSNGLCLKHTVKFCH